MFRRLVNKQLFVKANMDLLKRIRQETSAPMMQCKTALQETDNSYQKALDWLKKKGMSVAEKHADKSTRQGVIAVGVNTKRDTGVMLEVNCQTDFVAKNELFLRFVDKLLRSTLDSSSSLININNIEKQAEQENVKAADSVLEKMPAMRVFDDSCQSALEQKKFLISKVQQNVKVRRIIKLHNPNSRFGVYVHRQYQKGIGLQGCIAELTSQIQNPQPQQLYNEFCDNIATQILGSPPKYFSESQIPENIVNEQKQKIMESMKAALSKAPPEAHQRIISGKLNSTLYSPYVFNHMGYILGSSGEITVGEYWKSVERDLQTTIKLGKVQAWKCK